MSAVIKELSISAQELRRWLEDERELALLDVRDESEFAKGEPFYATNVPAARLLHEIERFVPRKAVRTVLVDGGDGQARSFARQLRATGRHDTFDLEGGVPAWTAQGGHDLPTFDRSGLKFSVSVRDEKKTPVVTAAQYRDLRAQGADVVVLDTRTTPEFARGHVPGAISAPGAELLYRFADLVPSPKTRVFVSCAGLPRAILGAQTLIDAKVPNPVSYLDDGTRGWTDIGEALEDGLARRYGPVSDTGRRFAHDHAQRFNDPRWPEIDFATAQAWSQDPSRTTYLLDVRSPEEFAASNLPGSISAEGGQLIAVSHRTLAVRGARVVLIDDADGLRALTTAHWLQQRGFEIALLRHDFKENVGVPAVA